MRNRATSRPTKEELISGIQKQDTVILSRAITLIESKLPADQMLASRLLDEIGTWKNDSIRIGITGVPGVGKSTFIESLGSYLTSMDNRIAILTIDPSSSLSHGSILGDKTRMEKLSMNDKAYIRPSPAGNTLGGVASNTREAILICEAAGYDIIIIETVGVGQSETLVKQMIDFFLLLMIPGAGDELQGIKRGIVEMADALIINKSDGKSLNAAKQAKEEYENALHLYPAKSSGWNTPVLTCSAIENTGIEQVWEVIKKFIALHSLSGWITQNRAKQNVQWLDSLIELNLKSSFFGNPDKQNQLEEIKSKVTAGEISVRHAVNELFS
ncbi:MAG: methylmalonyl Co-A mutase-associated GTPase MeaB [Cyclobacteriaceae bacterium]